MELEVFLEGLAGCDRRTLEEFAHECCTEAFEADEVYPMELPLLRQVVLPHLASGLEKRRMPQLFWIVEARRRGFERFVNEAIGGIPNWELLDSALEIDPLDRRVWDLLLKEYVDNLEYASNELPSMWVVDLIRVRNALEGLGRMIRQSPVAVPPQVHKFYVEIRAVYDAWMEYVRRPRWQTFERWCEERGIESEGPQCWWNPPSYCLPWV